MKKKVMRLVEDDKAESVNKVEITQEMSKAMMIQMLIPIGLKAVEEMLQEEVTKLTGDRYSHSDTENKRWGSNPGSVYLGEEKVGIKVPRVRNTTTGSEVPLDSYSELQSSSVIDAKTMAMVINGISTRRYEDVATKVPETFGIKRNSVSKKFIEGSAKKLKELLERDLSSDDIVAIFIDGKTFAENQMIIALGVDLSGEKKILGFVESGTENKMVIKDFLNGLIDRGLNITNEILFIIDGAKGLSAGIKLVFKKKAIIQRCQWHKRENVTSYLPKDAQKRIRKKLQDAYNQVKYSDAKASLTKIGKELQLMNESAYNSLQEGLEETLTLHKLDLVRELSVSLKTTNCIESINRRLEEYTRRVTYWKNSNQRQRWVATALLEVEGRMVYKVRGSKHLALLREQMRVKVDKINKSDLKKAA